MLVVLAVVFSSAFLSSRFLSRRLVARFKQPLAELEGGLRALRSGKLSSRLNPPRDREFEQAFRDFNDMAATLESISARQQRQEANRRRLLADIAHDVRSPLTSIRGYAEGLLDGIASTPERQQRYLSTIKDKAEQISELIDDLFELSKLDLDDRPLDLVPTRVDREIQEVVDHFQPDTGANLLFNLKLTPCTALIDQRLFRRALQNILQNTTSERRLLSPCADR